MSQESTDLFKVGQAVRQELDLYATKVSLGNVQISAGIQSYTTADLPGNSPNGAIAFDTTISDHVYFNDGRWLKLETVLSVADRVIEVKPIFRSLFKIGTGDINNLSNFQGPA